MFINTRKELKFCKYFIIDIAEIYIICYKNTLCLIGVTHPAYPLNACFSFLFKLWYNAAKNNQKIHMWKRFLKEHNGFSHSKFGTGLSATFTWEKTMQLGQ